MRLPGGEGAIVEDRKVRDYLLSDSHPVGRFKAAFFRQLGYGQDRAGAFKEALLTIAADGEVATVRDFSFGRKYLIPWTVVGPSGRSARVVTVWFVALAGGRPRLITVYPE